MSDGIGASTRRREDLRFTTGAGNYTADGVHRRQLTAYFVRSQHAHARLQAVNTQAAERMPGVVAVLTGEDWLADGLGTLPSDWVVTSSDGTPMKAAKRPPLTADKMRFVGDAVAVVLADTLRNAKDAAEAVEIDCEPLPCAPNVTGASQPDAATIHDVAPGNLCFSWQLGDAAAVDMAFADAAHVASIDLINTRLVPNPMEPRAALAHYDVGTGQATLTTTSQNPHIARQILAGMDIVPEHKLRVISPDVGGGFGAKIFVYPEESVCLWAARKLGRPVRWVCERTEAFMADTHGRDHVTQAELALSEDGTFLGMRVRTKAALGAYMSTFAGVIPTWMYATLLSGQYQIPAIHASVDAFYTNASPVDAYRGAGRPEAIYVVERLVDHAAREIGMDPAELRRRNFVPPDAFPYQTPVAAVYDSGNYKENFERALDLIDYAGFPKRKAAAEKKGLRRGIGISCYIECCGLAPSNLVGMLGSGIGYFETATVRMTPTGRCVVLTGTHAHGQGHETAFAQIVHDRLGVSVDDVEVVHGDTAAVPYGLGTYGSRSAAVGGSAIAIACDKIIAKATRIAGFMLDVDPNGITFADGVFRHPDTNQMVTVPEVAIAAFKGHVVPRDQLEAGLEESATYDPPNFTFPAGSYICEVEITPRTGIVRVVDLVAVDDFGHVINPMIVEGQVQGGIAQGIGQALFEKCVYDEITGQLLTASFLDYCMPRADDLPNFRVELAETPCPHNPLGVKGCGEAGTVAAPPAVMNAVIDAIGTNLDMPASPQRVWAALQQQEG
ncbi:MAG: xanthine dehydrogenase family protein molybdopterin-binding subunit [Pseudomonadota bacterium]